MPSLVAPAPPAHLPKSSSLPGKSSSGLQVSSLPKPTSKFPIVSLDVDAITDALAAKLAITLLGHVLFLKSQIPLPVLQLARIPSTKSSARAAKYRTDLLNSFDTLTSHLNTTFTALSTALALVKRSSKSPPSHPQTRSKVYLAILLGPSMSSSRSKMLFAVDGFESRVWGETEASKNKYEEVKGRKIAGGAKRREGEHEHEGERRERGEEGEDEDEEVNEGDEDEKDDEGGEREEEDEDEDEDEEPGEEEEEEEEGQSNEELDSDEVPPSPSPSPPPIYPSHAEEQRALQAAERLLARTLAAADAEGNGMSAEMAPTQTHVLIRAPRRFAHPAWVPRQNLAVGMEAMLEEFLEESKRVGVEPQPTPAETYLRKGKKAKVGVEGVWITDRQGLVPSDDDLMSGNEWDEMIWWSWDGKIVGFSEW